MKFVILLTALDFFAFTQPASSQSHPDAARQLTKFIEAFPATVYYLFQWPDAKVIEGERRVKSDCPDIAMAQKYSLEWIKRVIDANWLPPKESDVLCLRNEFNNRDTVRVQWEHDSYRIEASQTNSVFVLRITPIKGSGTGKGLKERARYARELSKEVFRDDAYMWPLNGAQPEPRIPVNHLKERIASFSFDPAQTRELSADKLAIGFEKSMEEDGGEPADDYVEDAGSKDPVDGTKQSAHYWFRNIRWWNDGKSVGFYFLKIDGNGAWPASYAGEIDIKWFRPPRDPTKRPLK